MPPLQTLIDGAVGALAVGTTLLLAPLLRPWYSHWGLRTDERGRTWPGDDAVPTPRSAITCAVDVAASADRVWPWFVQLGCRRAGWYSYDLLDNGGVPSAERIVPELQQLAVGDVVPAVPNGAFGFPVARIEPGRLLLLAGTLNTRTGHPADATTLGADPYFAGGQAFVLEPAGPGATRLVFRMRTGWNPTLLNDLVYRHLLEPVSFVMARRMLLNLRRRCEAAAA